MSSGRKFSHEQMLVAAAAALVLPLVVVIVWKFAPVLAAFGLLLALGLAAAKAGMHLPFLSKALVGGNQHSLAAVQSAPAYSTEQKPYCANSYSAAAAQQPPKEPGGIKGFWNSLWNSDKHGWIILGCLVYIIFPGDFDFIVGLGWVDDGFAGALAFKHFCDLIQGKPKHTAAMVTSMVMPQAVPRRDYPVECVVIDAEVVDGGKDTRAA